MFICSDPLSWRFKAKMEKPLQWRLLSQQLWQNPWTKDWLYSVHGICGSECWQETWNHGHPKPVKKLLDLQSWQSFNLPIKFGKVYTFLHLPNLPLLKPHNLPWIFETSHLGTRQQALPILRFLAKTFEISKASENWGELMECKKSIAMMGFCWWKKCVPFLP